ncbi:hypothetical protein ACFXHA_43550 [Nocardia sp. NPDC059240]|uniref:hypothetical protein n=1 Tax=Nocardia sp. NPDC059240 TaxID=3346786 RepID=UPI0036A3A9D5
MTITIPVDIPLPSVQLPDVEMPFWPAPMTATTTELAPTLVAEWAIKLPRGTWWRKLSTRVADPNGTTPTVFHDRGRAEDELFDLTCQAVSQFGVRRRDYQPTLMVRSVATTSDGILTVGQWRTAAPLPATSTAR